MKMMTQPGKFSIAVEGLNVGRDGGEPVTGVYPGEYPWPFTGTVKQVIVDVSEQGASISKSKRTQCLCVSNLTAI